MIEAHAQRRAEQILADHVITEVRIGRRVKRMCGLCQRPAPCPARLLAADLLLGESAPRSLATRVALVVALIAVLLLTFASAAVTVSGSAL